MATSCEQYITGGDETDCICGVPAYLVWGIGIVAVILLLGRMGTIDLPALGAKMFGGADGFGSRWQGAGSRLAQSTQAGLDGFRGREGAVGDVAEGALAAADAAALAAARAPSYGDYRGGDFGGEGTAPDQMDAADLKAAHDSDAVEAAADLWGLLGGENSCDLPVDVGAFAEALSLSAANGDGVNDFDADLVK